MKLTYMLQFSGLITSFNFQNYLTQILLLRVEATNFFIYQLSNQPLLIILLPAEQYNSNFDVRDLLYIPTQLVSPLFELT